MLKSSSCEVDARLGKFSFGLGATFDRKRLPKSKTFSAVRKVARKVSDFKETFPRCAPLTTTNEGEELFGVSQRNEEPHDKTNPPSQPPDRHDSCIESWRHRTVLSSDYPYLETALTTRHGSGKKTPRSRHEMRRMGHPATAQSRGADSIERR